MQECPGGRGAAADWLSLSCSLSSILIPRQQSLLVRCCFPRPTGEAAVGFPLSTSSQSLVSLMFLKEDVG